MIHYLGTLTDPSAPNNDCTTIVESDYTDLTLWFENNDGSPWTGDGISLSPLEVRQLQRAISTHQLLNAKRITASQLDDELAELASRCADRIDGQ